MNNSPSCERASDLIAFLYDEANDSERRDFELHLKECGDCREEVASFGLVRQSITTWRDEALSGFVSTPLAATTKKKSAIAALREFFDLSPLWLKGCDGLRSRGVLRACGARDNEQHRPRQQRGNRKESERNLHPAGCRSDRCGSLGKTG